MNALITQQRQELQKALKILDMLALAKAKLDSAKNRLRKLATDEAYRQDLCKYDSLHNIKQRMDEKKEYREKVCNRVRAYYCDTLTDTMAFIFPHAFDVTEVKPFSFEAIVSEQKSLLQPILNRDYDSYINAI